MAQVQAQGPDSNYNAEYRYTVTQVQNLIQIPKVKFKFRQAGRPQRWPRPIPRPVQDCPEGPSLQVLARTHRSSHQNSQS